MLKGRGIMPKDNMKSISRFVNNGVAYVKQNVDYILYRMNLHQNGRCTNIAFITDIHNGTTTTEDVVHSNSSSNSNYLSLRFGRTIAALKTLAKEKKIHCCILGGDYIVSPTYFVERDNAVNYLTAVNFFVKKLVSQMNVMICRGNHDGNSIPGSGDHITTVDNSIDIGDYSEIMQAGINGGTVNGSAYKDYGYYDDLSNKLRVIFLNMVDIPFSLVRGTSTKNIYTINGNSSGLGYNLQNNCYMRQEQIDFLIDALTIKETGWAVIIFSHIRPVASNFAPDGSTLQGIMSNILKAFRDGTSYSTTYQPNFKKTDNTRITDFDLDIEADFSGNGSNELICFVMGHIHTDGMQGFGYTNKNNKTCIFHSLRTRAFYTTDHAHSATGVRSVAFDIVTVDRTNKKLWFERYGEGVSRVFDYGTYSQYYTGNQQSPGLVVLKTRKVTVNVTDGSNNAVSGATVTLKYNGEDISGTTDANGKAVFTDQPYDKFTVAVSHDGSTASEPVEYSENDITVPISLQG